MAFMAPVLLGSAATGTAAATAGLVGSAGAFSAVTALSTLATAGSLLSTISAGGQQSQQYKAQARSEQFNARNREIDRKRNLIRSLASQNVRSASSGISSGVGSSAQAIQADDISQFNLDQTVDAGSTSQRVNQLKSNASNATTYSLLSAAGTAAEYGRREAKRGKV